ncbi:oxidoreductase [Desulfotomaculum copahuensis]|uniref:Oxidoreductase n=1 Tax=Desulfotomaculum copahuensis TaxID=1838280 RepID=A0A1B7LFT8_9FIRM|nr:Gfo/Idh/MocA family oxidoreductase [Desulfotomaculum copahuensis]OAT83597.1 oxidoreductase [Desulfotomaculum copahuensis]
MRKLKVGVIGAGMAFARLHHPAYQQLGDRYEIAAVCDRDAAKARVWAGRLNLDERSVFTDWREMLRQKEDLDVIDIMVPIALNFEITEGVAKTLAGRRKGIICEKPLAPTLEQAEASRELARKYRIPVMIAENYRYNHEIDLLRDLVRTGRAGDIYYFIQNRVVDFQADMLQDKFPATEWRQHPEFPGGTVTDTALHDLAGLRHIFGPVDRLQAFGRPQAAGYSPYAVIQVNLLFKSGVTGHFSFFCAGREMQRPLIGLRIFGTKGMIYLEERDAGTINLAFNDGRKEQVPYQVQRGYYNELLNFYNALTGSEPVSVTPEMEYGDLKTVHDILKSIAEGEIVPVDGEDTYRPVYAPALGGQAGIVQ